MGLLADSIAPAASLIAHQGAGGAARLSDNGGQGQQPPPSAQAISQASIVKLSESGKKKAASFGEGIHTDAAFSGREAKTNDEASEDKRSAEKQSDRVNIVA